MAGILYWPIKLVVVFLHFVFRCVFGLVYWGQKKTVPPIKNNILLKSATTLATEIREGKLKSEEVIKAYIERINEVNPFINAVIEKCFLEALEEARAVDKLIESGELTSQQICQEKPLLGVPFTVKNLLAVKGYQYTRGCLIFKNTIATEDAPTVGLIKKAGGILLAITNVPEFGLAMETYNYFFGRTCNPYDTTRTPGGSSGGESAIISAAGSVIGLANDLAGSLRFPANFCGLFAHKATAGMITNKGTIIELHPEVNHLIMTGPMCRYAEDLIKLVNVLSNNDPSITFKQQVDFTKLKIYYQTDVKFAWGISTESDIAEAVLNAIRHFETIYGCVTKEVNIPLISRSNMITLHLVMRHIPNVIEFLTSGKEKHINIIYELIKFIFGKSTYMPMTILLHCFLRFPLCFKEKNVPIYEEMYKKLGEQFDSLLDENSIFITPTFPVAAPRHNEVYPATLTTCFTLACNLASLPTTQCPMGLNKNGIPVGIQIAGRKGNDALTLACAVELEKAFGGWIPPGIFNKK